MCMQPIEAYPQGCSLWPLSGGNYNLTIRDKVCCSQLELGFNWTAVIGIQHLEVEFNAAAFFLLWGDTMEPEMQQLVSRLAQAEVEER